MPTHAPMVIPQAANPAANQASVPPWMMNQHRMPTRAPAPMAPQAMQPGMRPPPPGMYGAARPPVPGHHNPLPAFNSKIGYWFQFLLESSVSLLPPWIDLGEIILMWNILFSNHLFQKKKWNKMYIKRQKRWVKIREFLLDRAFKESTPYRAHLASIVIIWANQNQL